MAYLGDISHRLRSHSPRTITKPAEFLREMEKVRAQGYAVNRGEWRQSVGGCAAPIFDPAGGVIASIGLSGPIDRLRPSMFKAMSPDLIKGPQELEPRSQAKVLGFRRRADVAIGRCVRVFFN
ncbi:MAG: hypothetical protein LH632_23540 [Rhodoferax sp.]|nr:hypothetical protein [Rhodoferax sp.]